MKSDIFYKSKNWTALFLTFYAIMTSMALNHGDTTLGSSGIHFVFTLCKNIVALLAVVFFIFKLRNGQDSKWLYIFLPFFLFAIFHISIDALLGILVVLVFSIVSKKDKSLCYESFRLYMIITGALGLVALSSYFLGLPIPHSIVPYYTQYEATNYYFYIDYGFSYLCVNNTGVRLCGLFNEPGYYGTIAAFYLIADNFNLKSKGNIIILLSGLLTVSLAFIVLCIMFFLLKIYRFNSFFKNVSYIIILFGLLVLVGLISNDVISNVADRFSFEGGTFKGDNRSNDSLDFIFNQVISGNEYTLFGYGSLDNLDIGHAGGIKKFIVQYGLVGGLLTLSLLLVSSIRYEKLSVLKFCFVFLFFVSLYQRSSIFNLCYFMALFGGLCHIAQIDGNGLNKMKRTVSNRLKI